MAYGARPGARRVRRRPAEHFGGVTPLPCRLALKYHDELEARSGSMRFGKAPPGLINAVAAVGLLALMPSGGLPLLGCAALAAGFAIALLVNDRVSARPWLRRAVLTLSLLSLAALSVRTWHNPLLLFIEIAAVLQILR